MFFAQASGRFCPGRLVATPLALEEIPANEWQAALCRHLRCDWGVVCERDWNANDDAVQSGERLPGAAVRAGSLSARAMSRAFERGARRYDGGYPLY